MNFADKLAILARDDLASDPAVQRASLAIIELLGAASLEDTNHLTYRMLSEKVGADPAVTLGAIQYLSGSRADALRTCFEYIDGNFVQELSKEEVARAVEDGEFYDNRTGERVEQFEKKIFLYFTPSPKFSGRPSK